MSFDVTTLALAKSYADQHSGGGAGDFIIKMTVEDGDDGDFTVTSCDATVEQIDAAVADEKRVVLVASNNGAILELPMIRGDQGSSYRFGVFLYPLLLTASVEKNTKPDADYWQFYCDYLTADNFDYYNAALPDIYSVKHALDVLVSNSHTHANKDTLDKLSVSNGKLQYNGSDVALKGDGIVIQDTTNSVDYIAQLRLVNGKPVIEYVEK